jgi:hypothetical protein
MSKSTPDGNRPGADAPEQAVTVVLALVLAGVLAAIPAAGQTQPAPLPAASSAPVLLPIYGVDLELDQSWLDGTAFPSTSGAYPNQGASASLQAVWQALSPSGINVLRVTLDVSDSHTAGLRLANLVAWAESSGATVIPELVPGPAGRSASDGFASRAADTVRGALAALGAQGRVSAYSRVLLYQVGRDANHAGRNGGLTGDTAAAAARSAAAAVRQAETDALAQAGLGLTPIMVQASFDCELVRVGALAGTVLTEDGYAQALASLRTFVAGVAAAQEIDEIAISWYPGSVGAGGAERFTSLLGTLAADAAGKPLLFTTGASTAFQPPEQQRQLVSVAFANLADLRASQGESSPVNGLMFHHALRPASADEAPPADVQAALAAWDPAERATELAQAWQGGAESPALAWWELRTEDAMGLLALDTGQGGAVTVTPQPGGDALAAIASAVGEVVAQAVAGGDTQGGQTGTIKEKVGEAVGGLTTQVVATVLDHVFQKLSASLESALGTGSKSGGGAGQGSYGQGTYGQGSYGQGTSGQAAGGAGTGTGTGTGTEAAAGAGIGVGAASTSGTESTAGAAPVVAIASAALEPASPEVGQPAVVSVQVQNSGGAAAAALAVGVVDAEGFLVAENALVEGLSVPAQGTVPASVPWTPVQEGSQVAQVKVYDAAWAELASAPVTLAGIPATATSGGGTETEAGAATGGGTGTGTAAGTGTGGGTGRVPGLGGHGVGTLGGAAGSGTGSGAKEGGPFEKGRLHVAPAAVGAFRVLGPGFPRTGQLQVLRSSKGDATVDLPLANTTSRPLPALTATLLLGGAPAGTEDLSTILPGQTRTVSFRGVTLPGGKPADLKVALTRHGAAPLIAAEAKLDLATLPTSPAAAAPISRTGAKTRTPLPPPRPLTATLHPAPTPAPSAATAIALRPMTATAFKPGHPSPTPTPASAFAAPKVATAATLGRTQPPPVAHATPTPVPALPRTASPAVQTAAAPAARAATTLPSANLRPDPALLAADLRVSPTASSPGQRLVATAEVHNPGSASAEGVHVAFALADASGAVVAKGDVAVGALAPLASRPVSWPVTLPANGPWVVTATVRANADAVGTNNQATARVALATTMVTKARPR